MPFLCFGVKVNAYGIPELRTSADMFIRRLPEPAWQLLKGYMNESIEELRTCPLDDVLRTEKRDDA